MRPHRKYVNETPYVLLDYGERQAAMSSCACCAAKDDRVLCTALGLDCLPPHDEWPKHLRIWKKEKP